MLCDGVRVVLQSARNIDRQHIDEQVFRFLLFDRQEAPGMISLVDESFRSEGTRSRVGTSTFPTNRGALRTAAGRSLSNETMD